MAATHEDVLYALLALDAYNRGVRYINFEWFDGRFGRDGMRLR